MDTKLEKYQSFRNLIGKLLVLSGIWPYPENKIHFYRVISLYGIVIFTIIVAKSFFFCLDNLHSVSMLVRGMSNFLSLSTLLLKLIIFVVHRQDLMLLENELGKRFEDELMIVENRPILLEKINVYTKFMFIVASLLFVSLSMYTIAPIIILLKTHKYVQIYYGKYPFTVIPGTTRYWIVNFFELTAGFYIWTVMNGVDSAFGLHCYRIGGLLRIAGHRCKQLKPYDPNHRFQLRECVKLHQLVLRAKESLQNAYGIIVIWTYITSAIIMCSLMWQATQLIKVLTPYRGFYFLCYITLKFMQAYTYAYYGSTVSYESENYEYAIYLSKWPGSGNVRLMKDLLIIRSQRTVTLKALGYFVVTMQMFEKIIQTTVSYFCLLQTVDSKN